MSEEAKELRMELDRVTEERDSMRKEVLRYRRNDNIQSEHWQMILKKIEHLFTCEDLQLVGPNAVADLLLVAVLQNKQHLIDLDQLRKQLADQVKKYNDLKTASAEQGLLPEEGPVSQEVLDVLTNIQHNVFWRGSFLDLIAASGVDKTAVTFDVDGLSKFTNKKKK